MAVFTVGLGITAEDSGWGAPGNAPPALPIMNGAGWGAGNDGIGAGAGAEAGVGEVDCPGAIGLVGDPGRPGASPPMGVTGLFWPDFLCLYACHFCANGPEPPSFFPIIFTQKILLQGYLIY